MSRIHGRDTLPEIIVRKALHAKGWRFRVCDKRFAGRPDVVVPKAKTIIDIRGCFWHRHGCRDSTMPKTNVAFWMEKWSKNVRRDIRNEEEWVREGWNRIIVWECALAPKSQARTLERIADKVALWAGETARKVVRRKPHRLELPPKVRKDGRLAIRGGCFIGCKMQEAGLQFMERFCGSGGWLCG